MGQDDINLRARDNDDCAVTVLLEILRIFIIKKNSEPLSDDEWMLFRHVADTLLAAKPLTSSVEVISEE